MLTTSPFPAEGADILVADICARLRLLKTAEPPVRSVGLVFFATQQQHGPVVVKVKPVSSPNKQPRLPACIQTPKLLANVCVGEFSVEVWQRIPAAHITKTPSPWVLAQVEDTLVSLARCSGDDMSPADYQLVVDNIRARLEHRLVTPCAAATMQQVVDAASALAQAPGSCLQHGDFNRGNLLVDDCNSLWVIDWDSAHSGPAEWDAATAAMVLLTQDRWPQFFSNLKARGLLLDKAVLQAAFTLKAFSAFSYVHALNDTTDSDLTSALVSKRYTISSGLAVLASL